MSWDFNPREDLDLKEPIVHEGKTPDWESHENNASRVVEDGKVNWMAAMNADPGVMSCPNCDEYLWRCGRVVECPECGHKWDRREGEVNRVHTG